MVVDEKGSFRDDNFQKAVAVLTETDASGKGEWMRNRPCLA